MGTLLTAFRSAKVEALRTGKKALWDRNKLGNPQKRGGYEIREEVVSFNGNTDIHLQLWKKIDSHSTRITADVKSGEIGQEDDIEELMK